MKHSVIHWTLAALCAFCWAIGTFTLTAQAQTDNWLWVKTADSVLGKITPASLASDLNGNTYIAGSFRGRARFGDSTYTASGGDDIFIIKYNRKGEIVWMQKFGSAKNESITSIAVDGSGNLYAAGSFVSDTLIVGWKELILTSTSSMFVARFASTGELAWADTPKGNGILNSITSIATTLLGDIYLTGSYQSPFLTFGSNTQISKVGNNIDMFVAKYNSGGECLWAKDFGTEGENIGKAISTDLDGNCYVAGISNGKSITFGTAVFQNTVTTPATNDFFVIKLSPTGVITWAKHGAGAKNDEVRAIKADPAGNCYITGTFRSSKLTIDNTNLDVVGLGAAFVVKFGTNGSPIWGKSFGGQSEEIGNGISFDAAQNAYIIGTFRSDILNFNSSVQIVNNGDIFTADVFIAKFAPTGDVLSAASGGSQGNDVVAAISVDADGQYLIAGSAPSDTITFGDKKAIGSSIKDTSSGGSINIFVAKYGNGAVGVQEDAILSSGKVICFPQPATRTITLKITLEKQSPLSVEIVDILGNRVATVYQEQTIIGENSISCPLDVPTGTYGYRLKSAHITQNGMFQVLR
jgi:hypothetical protein